MNSNEKLDLLLDLVVDTAPEEIDCEEVMHRLAAFVEAKAQDSGSEAPKFAVLKQHLKVCHECVEELELLEKILGPED